MPTEPITTRFTLEELHKLAKVKDCTTDCGQICFDCTYTGRFTRSVDHPHAQLYYGLNKVLVYKYGECIFKVDPTLCTTHESRGVVRNYLITLGYPEEE